MVLSFQPHSVSQDGDGRLGPIVPDGDFEQCEEEPPVAMTDSKGWSYELPKTEESSRHMELTDGDEGGEEKLVQENRLRMARGHQEEKVSPELGKGEMIVPLKCEEKEQESLFAVRYIIDECVGKAVCDGGDHLEKNGSKGIFDADDDAGRKEARGKDVTMSNRSSKEISRPSPHPRLAAWLLREGASEAQVDGFFMLILENGF